MIICKNINWAGTNHKCGCEGEEAHVGSDSKELEQEEVEQGSI